MAFVDGSVADVLKLDSSSAGGLLMSSGSSALLELLTTSDLLNVVYISEVNAISSTRIRVEFSQPVDRTVALQTISSWRIERLAANIGIVTTLEIDLPEGVITSVDLVTTEMSEGGSYRLSIISGAVTANGIPVAQNTTTFTGIGIAPELVVVIATSSNTVTVRFSEAIRNAGGARDIATYVFSDPPSSLIVLEVLDLEENTVTLKTTEQDPNVLYTLTVDGVIQDNAQNELIVPIDSPMLGFREPAEQIRRLQLDMYSFLPANLREIDLQKGRLFIKRLVDGPQVVWQAINQGLIDILDLWSVVRTRDENVYLLQDLLGWVGSLAAIPDALEPRTKRRLLQASADFWSNRGPENAIVDIIRLCTGARARVLNYFDFRWIVGETEFGEDHEGHDPWLIADSPLDNELIQFSAASSRSGSDSTLQSFAFDMGSADVLVLFTICAGHRPLATLTPSPFSILRYNGVSLNRLSFIETKDNPSGREILVEAWWVRGLKGMNGNLEWQFNPLLAPPNSGWHLTWQQVVDISQITVSDGQVAINALSINDAMESNPRMMHLTACGTHQAFDPVPPTTGIRASGVEAVRMRMASRVGVENVAEMAFIGTSLPTAMVQLSVGLLGAPSGIIAGGEQEYQIRVVDDGTLDHELIRNIARITRPTNERVDIFYVGFLDLFITDDDKSQWTDQAGESQVSDGEMVLPADDALVSTYVSIDQSLTWSEYSVTWKVKGETSLDLLFYRTAETDQYFVRVTTAPTSPSGRGLIELWVRNANVNTLLSSAALPVGFYFADNLYHCIRVEVSRVGALNAIKVIVDTEIILSTTNGVHTAGSIGARRQDSTSGGVLTLDEVELFFFPAIVDRIEINE